MSPNPAWPSNPTEIVLWAQLMATWIIASYVAAPRVGDDNKPYRLGSAAPLIPLVLVGATAWFLPPYGSSTQLRGSLTALLIIAMTANLLVRRRIGSGPLRRHLAEWEVSVNVAAGVATAGTIGLAKVGGLPEGTIVRSGKVAAAWCVVAAVGFVFRGGTYIVRSVLDKANAVPHLPAPPGSQQPAPDIPELNRGRAIGNIERLLMLMVISLGSYEALGFLVAAKGLIRAREFEDRNFAEYFILGSLTSVAVALVAGMLLRVVLTYLWTIP
jgi:hypothetical protein